MKPGLALDLSARFDRLREIDWDFPTSGSRSSFSSLHWHPCRYPSQVPALIIGALTSPGEVVLDPFLGSGTSAVEAQRLSRRSLGIELNPVGVLIGRSKTINRPVVELKRLFDQIRIGVRQSSKRAPVPITVQAEKWYTNRTLHSLQRLRLLIDGLNGDKRLIAEAAFSAILLPVCRETRHWGYVCDNTAPKTDYERDVFEAFERTLGGFEEAYRERDDYWSTGNTWPREAREARIDEGDARTLLKGYAAGSVHLIVTSPPYFGVADYTKAQRLTLEWMGRDIEPLRIDEIGARSKRRRLTAPHEYLDDCKQVFTECRRVLKKGRACAVIFGESTERAAMCAQFIQTLETCGFTLEYSASRKISSRRRLTPRLQMENLLLFT